MNSIKDIIKNSKELSSLPEIYRRVAELLDDESSTSEQIGSLVQSDPALTVRILKVVNSAYYGFPNEISTISQAVNILGRNPLRQLLMGTVLGGVFSRLTNNEFLIDEFWQHSVHTAVMSQFCYENLVGKLKSDEIFIAGLLHDIGHLVIAHQLHEESALIKNMHDEGHRSFLDIEQEVLGFSHNDVAAALMEQWELPAILSQCALHHHTPTQAQDYSTQTWIIHIADCLTKQPFITDPKLIYKQLHEISDWQKSTLTEEDIIDAYLNANEHFKLVLSSFGL